MRWNKSVTLLTPAEAYQDEEGGWHYGEPVERVVFCNERSMGTMTMAHLRSSDVRMANSNEPIDVGMRHEHLLELRSIDYHNEDRCIFEGEEYEVMFKTGSGEKCVIAIGQRIGNSRPEGFNG